MVRCISTVSDIKGALREPTSWRAAVVATWVIINLLPGRASAEGNLSPLTFGEARRLALERNTDLRVAQVQVEAALAVLRVAREFPNPNLGLSTAKISTDGTPEGTALGNSIQDRSYDSIASLSQLFVVGKRGLVRDAASAGVRSAEFQRDDARRLLIQAVAQAYVAALSSLKQADVLTDSAGKLRREADIAEHRFKVGDISSSDKAQLEIAADQDELNSYAERAIAKTAVVTLEILLGEPRPSGATPLADTLDQWVEKIPASLEQAPIGMRPDIKAAESAVGQADVNIRLQKRLRIPDITASIQFERNPPGQTNTVGIGISLPLPLWNHFNGEILAAKAAQEQTQAQLDKIRIQAAADLAEARLSYVEASQRARRYQSSLVPRSAEVTKNMSYAFQKGGATLTDLLEAERNDNVIRLAAVQSQADVAITAVSLQAALGHLDGSDVN